MPRICKASRAPEPGKFAGLFCDSFSTSQWEYNCRLSAGNITYMVAYGHASMIADTYARLTHRPDAHSRFEGAGVRVW